MLSPTPTRNKVPNADLRDDVPGPLDEDRVAHPQVKGRDVADVVERGAADGHAVERDGLQLRHRDQDSGPEPQDGRVDEEWDG